MSAVFLDPYRQGTSLLHRADARLKLLMAIGFILSAALLPDGSWPALIMLLSLVISLAQLSQVGLMRILRRSLLALPFLLAALPVLFSRHGQALAQFSLFGLPVSISQPGLERFLTVVLKSWVSLLAAALLAAVTPFPQMLAAMRAMRAPRLLVAVIGLMWRYVFTMAGTAAQLLRARDSRSAASLQEGLRSGGKLTWRARVTGGMAGSLLLRSVERSERVYAAMLARGYDGEVRGTSYEPLHAGGWATLICAVAFYAGLVFFAWLLAG